MMWPLRFKHCTALHFKNRYILLFILHFLKYIFHVSYCKFLFYIYDSWLFQYLSVFFFFSLIMLIVKHQNTKANSLYMKTYLARNLILILCKHTLWKLGFKSSQNNATNTNMSGFLILSDWCVCASKHSKKVLKSSSCLCLGLCIICLS